MVRSPSAGFWSIWPIANLELTQAKRAVGKLRAEPKAAGERLDNAKARGGTAEQPFAHAHALVS